jgi:hypothetical protein
VLAWLVLAAALLEVAAPAVTINGPGTSPGGGSGPELLITPVGWAFSIWGVIYALAIAQAILVLARDPELIPRRLQIDQLTLYVGGALWILMAALDNSVATAAVLAIMFAAAVDGLLTARNAHLEQRWLARLSLASIGLYAGWVTAAFFLNISTALVDVGVFGADELSWQVGVLICAVVTLIGFTIAARGALTYVAAGCWAFVGIAVTGAANSTRTVTVLAIVSAVALVVVASALRLRDRNVGVGTT